MGVFKSYDVRGIYPETINEELAYKIGRAVVLHLKSKKIAIGRDCRISSSALTKSLIYGITDQGADVINLGLVNTPCCYFASKNYDTIMVTASHNPPEYNGFKITKKGFEKIGFDTGLNKIQKLVEKGNFPESRRKGQLAPKNIIKDYVKKIRSLTKVKIKPLKVLFDTGNGMGGLVVPELMKGLKIKYQILYKELDGNFPNHLADPVQPKNTAELQKKVVKGKYDLGVAYDADCDRVKFIDEKGNRIISAQALVLMANLMRSKKAVRTVSCSRIIDDNIKKVYISPVGHVHVARVMKKYDCDIGTEISGHFFFKKYWYTDSGDAAVIMMLAVLSKYGKKLSELVAPLKKYATSQEINFKVKDQDKTLKKIEKAFSKAKISKIDGLSIDMGEYWFNIRKSNTQPLIRLDAEAKTQKALKECIKKVKALA
jgi:phosphomannomutase